MRQDKIYYQDIYADLLVVTDDRDFLFTYDEQYAERYPHQFLTFTMPVCLSSRLINPAGYFHFLGD
jgi:serine/threonine-protein kinase HipA